MVDVEKTMNRVCAMCGRADAAGLHFCKACGVPLEAAAAPRSEAPPAPGRNPAPLAALFDDKLALAEAARRSGQAQIADAIHAWVVELDPLHAVARQPDPEPEPTRSSSPPAWAASWMSSSGEDEYGRWGAATIRGVVVRFRYCPPGRFIMGSPESEVGRWPDEGPQHEATLSRGLWLGEVPVTQRLWEAVAGYNPSVFTGEDLPVENVTWHECEAWMAHVTPGTEGSRLRFPTQAEWEYACRAGTTGATYRGGNDEATLDAIAWYAKNSGGCTHPVKQKAPNPWGLHDMLGNVWEWCADSMRVYTASPVVDPTGGEPTQRVLCGGSWGVDARSARTAIRYPSAPDGRERRGFRLARGE